MAARSRDFWRGIFSNLQLANSNKKQLNPIKMYLGGAVKRLRRDLARTYCRDFLWRRKPQPEEYPAYPSLPSFSLKHLLTLVVKGSKSLQKLLRFCLTKRKVMV